MKYCEGNVWYSHLTSLPLCDVYGGDSNVLVSVLLTGLYPYLCSFRLGEWILRVFRHAASLYKRRLPLP